MNRYVLGRGTDTTAHEALGGFRRFPTWMWHNTEVLAFIEWLQAYNTSVTELNRVGLYGLDLYSFHTSMAEVSHYLDKVDTEVTRRARYRYACFDHYGEDT